MGLFEGGSSVDLLIAQKKRLKITNKDIGDRIEKTGECARQRMKRPDNFRLNELFRVSGLLDLTDEELMMVIRMILNEWRNKK